MKLRDSKTFDLTWDQVDSIIIDDLKNTLSFCLESEDTYDVKLAKAIKRVLRHYMPIDDYNQLKRELALDEMVRVSEKLGLYDDDVKSSKE